MKVNCALRLMVLFALLMESPGGRAATPTAPSPIENKGGGSSLTAFSHQITTAGETEMATTSFQGSTTDSSLHGTITTVITNNTGKVIETLKSQVTLVGDQLSPTLSSLKGSLKTLLKNGTERLSTLSLKVTAKGDTIDFFTGTVSTGDKTTAVSGHSNAELTQTVHKWLVGPVEAE